jgi:hypothetical protein
MPGLAESLQGRDLGHLRIIAELWDLDFKAPDAKIALQRLVPILLNESLLHEVVNKLSSEARSALNELQQNGGSLAWAYFTRRHGIVREMGSARRDRERPYLVSPSPTESLWYRGLMSRGFFETGAGLEEFAYIPDDMLVLLPVVIETGCVVFGRPATPSEKAVTVLATDRLVDHACTLLAAQRSGLSSKELTSYWRGHPDSHLLRLWLQAAGLLDASGQPIPEPVRLFLEGNRYEALVLLSRTWLTSRELNDLKMLPDLLAEGDWQNDPLQARLSVLSFLPEIQQGSLPDGFYAQSKPFWSIRALIADVRHAEPDFQRSSGDYDSWYLRDRVSGEFLHGFENWERVDGALIRYIISGPLHWCGIVDLALPSADAPPSAFRFTSWAPALLKGIVPEGFTEENERVIARSDARIFVPRRVPRSIRYQIARFCYWREEKEDGYYYQITPRSLDHARQSGLRVSHLISLLRRSSETVPPALTRALERWDENGTEASFERVVVLRLGSSELLKELRKSRAARFLGDPLGPSAVIVEENAVEKVVAVLAEMGYLSKLEIEDFP